MAKRFSSTEIWNEDWFLEMPLEYKLFWHYVLSSCNHAGIFKVNLKTFCGINHVTISPEDALKYFNNGKDRIRVIADGVWLIEDFYYFQYGSSLNIKNRVHASIKKEYEKFGVKLTSIRGLVEVNDGVKDKDKDKDILDNKGNTLAAEKIDAPTVPPQTPEALQPVEDLAEGAINDEVLMMAAMTQANVRPDQLPAAKAKYPDLINDFVIHLKSEGKNSQTFQGFRNHFKNWFNKRLNSKPPPGPPPKAQALSAAELIAQRQKPLYVPPTH